MTTVQTPHVSVIVPTYGRGHRIPVLLERLATVELSDRIEVVIVDQSERPLTVERCGPSAGRFLKFSVAVLPKPNVSAARNAGAVRSSAPLLLFLDDDMELEASFITALLRLFEDPHCSIRGPQFALPGTPPTPRRDDEVVSFLPTGALAVRREAFLAVGGFDINLRRFCEDAEFCHRMKLAGHQLIKSHALIAIHHHAPAGGTYSQASAADRAWTLMDQSFYFHRRIGGSPSELPRVAFDLMRSEYRRTRERGALSILTMALLMLASVAPACLSSFRKPRLLTSAEVRL